MNYLLDTNILLTYLRDNEERQEIERTYNIFSPINNPLLCVVSIGEIQSIAKRNNWGDRRLRLLDEILNALIIIDINSEDVIAAYAEIDAYSQGKLLDRPLPTSARNMGKNDIWIAATCSVTNATLLTKDKDFSHLDKVFINLVTL